MESGRWMRRLNPNLPSVYTLRGVAREGAGDEKGAEATAATMLEMRVGHGASEKPI